MRVWKPPRAPALREKTPPPHRRARACPSPSFALQKKRLLFSSGPKGTKTPPLADGQRGGQAPALREKTPSPHRRARACPSPSSAPSNNRGGLSPALREHRDPRSRLPERHRVMKHSQVNLALFFLQRFRHQPQENPHGEITESS